MMHRALMTTPLGLACLLGCGGGAEPRLAAAETAAAATRAEAPVETCRVVEAGRPLPEEVRETSGLAQSRRDPGRFWTHNDSGGDPDLFALDADGRVTARVRVTGAVVEDWEDLEAGPCPDGACLYVGDIGDNDQARSEVTVYRIPEPAPGESASRPAAVLRARFPDAPQDAEALFLLPSGDLYLVTKGRHGPIALYRYPAPLRPGETVTLERVKELWPQPKANDDRVTSATATPDGRWVGIRTYRSLFLFPAARLVGPGPVEPVAADLSPLEEGQGEALVLADDGTAWVTSEAAKKKEPPRWSRLSCTLPGG